MSKEITVIEARDLIEDDRNLQLLDVRPESEFDKGNVVGFVNIPLSKLAKEQHTLNTNKQTLLLCASGTDSHQATQLLEAYGVEARVIRGGYDTWKQVIID
ncbi:MAG: rhodanese-related sulfurtransferase [bacterium]|jgi:rhodanese-related sulfurtransferase